MARILVIDDDERSNELTQIRLTKAGFDVTSHRGPFGSLNAIRSGEYDLILLDVFMPGLDGPGMMQLLRSTPGGEKTKVLFFSSMDPEALVLLVTTYGAHGYISKSCSSETLVAKIAETIQRP
jgi:DNA-binding response OmpR family regulator